MTTTTQNDQPRYVVVQRKTPRGPAVHDTHLDQFAGFSTLAAQAADKLNTGERHRDVFAWRTRAEAAGWFGVEPIEPFVEESYIEDDAAARVTAFLDEFDKTSGGYGEEDVIANGATDLLASDLRTLLALAAR